MSPSQTNIYCTGVNHKSASVKVREFLYLNKGTLEKVLPNVKEKHDLDEIVVLSTCNRFEMYSVSSKGFQSAQEMLDAYLNIQVFAGKAFDPIDFDNHAYCLEGLKAVEHIFSVAASLDSLVVGETQIIGQFKEALQIASRANTLGPILDKLSQEALGYSKRARSQSKIGEKTVSIGHTAVDLAKSVFTNLGEKTFLVLGAGDMAKNVVRYALSYQPKEIFIVNRTKSKAQNLVKSLGGGSAHQLDELSELLSKTDIVIAATSSPDLLITPRILQKATSKQNSRRIFLVDIAMPRNICSHCGSEDNIYLFDIDDLQKTVDANKESRRNAAFHAKSLVMIGAKQYYCWLSSVAVKPILSGFKDYVARLAQQERARTLGKPIFDDLTPSQVKAIDKMLQSITGKLVADAARAINDPNEIGYKESLANALCQLFKEPSSSPFANGNEESWQQQLIHFQ